MTQFKPITPEAKQTITAFTYANNWFNCDFAFANMCSWRFLYKSEYAIIDGFLVVRFYVEEKNHLAYMFPVGSGDRTQIIERMEEDAKKLGHTLLILGVTPEAIEYLNTLFPEMFTYIKERNYFDYIYLRESLVSLKGKKFQSKRNHINRFKNSYNYRYTPITDEFLPACIAFSNEWLEEKKEETDVDELINENRSIQFALNHFSELGLTGGAILIDEQLAAFTYGSPINHQTFCVHCEKADTQYEGIYSAINQFYVAEIPEQYTYINREEDLGLEGLRKAKESYQPSFLLEKHAAIKKK